MFTLVCPASSMVTVHGNVTGTVDVPDTAEPDKVPVPTQSIVMAGLPSIVVVTTGFIVAVPEPGVALNAPPIIAPLICTVNGPL